MSRKDLEQFLGYYLELYTRPNPDPQYASKLSRLRQADSLAADCITDAYMSVGYTIGDKLEEDFVESEELCDPVRQAHYDKLALDAISSIAINRYDNLSAIRDSDV